MRRTPNTKAAAALTAIRNARDAGATEAAQIAAGEAAAGGDDQARRIVKAIWAAKFEIMGAN